MGQNGAFSHCSVLETPLPSEKKNLAKDCYKDILIYISSCIAGAGLVGERRKSLDYGLCAQSFYLGLHS